MKKLALNKNTVKNIKVKSNIRTGTGSLLSDTAETKNTKLGTTYCPTRGGSE